MLHPNETDLTHSYKYISHTINWLPTIFAREFNFSDRRFFLLLLFFFCSVPVQIFGIVKDWVFVPGIIFCNFQKVAFAAFVVSLHGKL